MPSTQEIPVCAFGAPQFFHIGDTRAAYPRLALRNFIMIAIGKLRGQDEEVVLVRISSRIIPAGQHNLQLVTSTRSAT
jgi:hypothetical protein